MAEPGRVVVMDRDGRRGTISAYHPNDKRFLLVVEDQRLLLPSDVLIVQDDGTYTVPMRFAELERFAGEEGREQVVVPVVEEQLHVERRQVETGRVRIRKTVHEREAVVDEPLLEDHIEVERVKVNRPLQRPVDVRVEGDTTIIPVMKEVLVVEKRLVLAEELHIKTTRRKVERPQHVTLRTEEAQVERVP